jgi:hypothetical protein
MDGPGNQLEDLIGASPDTIETVDLTSSCIGFGCASLGSRIAASAGLRALEAAYAERVTWFDVAPPYDAGEAEAILGRLLAGNRQGECRDEGRSRAAAALRADEIRLYDRAASRRTGEGTASISGRSLLSAIRRRRSAPRSSARRWSSRMILIPPRSAAMRSSGRSKISSAAARRARSQSRASSMRRRPLWGRTFPMRRSRPTTIHSPSRSSVCARACRGSSRSLHIRSSTSMERARNCCADLHRGYDEPVEKAVADLLLDRAFAVNPEGVVLASMFSEKNRIANLARARRPADPRAISLVGDLFGGRGETAQ